MSPQLFFNELLKIKNVDPAHTLVMRHQPQEPELRRHFRWLALNRPDLFTTYQNIQRERQETQLSKAKYLASFIGHEAGKALFIGLYKNVSSRNVTFNEYWNTPGNIELRSLGMSGSESSRKSFTEFDLKLAKPLSDLRGRLIVGWPGGERTWSRWAYKNDLPVESIELQAAIEPEMPHWRALVLPWPDLKMLWSGWQTTLSHWRGIYFIFDSTDNKGYVGSASGAENLLGRWTNYASSGHGGNKLLKNRDPNSFTFSILELVSPTALQTDVVNLEQTWKRRLSTIAPNGLNEQ